MSCVAQSVLITSPSTRAKELALSARKLLDDLKELESGMVVSDDFQHQSHRRTTSSPLPSSSSNSNSNPNTSLNFRRRHRSSRTFSHDYQHSASSGSVYHSHRDVSPSSLSSLSIFDESTSTDNEKPQITGAFTSFCDNLLYMNQIWKQEKQIRALQASIKATQQAKSSNAFKSFCDRLLLSNRIWQLEKQVEELITEGERNKRGRVAAITRAAKQMAIDVRKESMIEEFVLDLITELQQCKQTVERLKEEHECEIREVHGDWLKEHRRLQKDNERLQLEKQSRLAEQEVSNELEQSLCDNLGRSRQRVQELEQFEGDGESTLFGDAFEIENGSYSRSASALGGNETDDVTEFDEEMSMSSVTCVSVQNPGKQMTSSVRLQPPRQMSKHGHSKSPDVSWEKKRSSGMSLRPQSLQPRKLDTTPYAGFSFNPLFFGNPEALVVSPRTENVEAPVKMTMKLTPSIPKGISREWKDSTMKPLRPVGPITSTTRGPWRI